MTPYQIRAKAGNWEVIDSTGYVYASFSHFPEPRPAWAMENATQCAEELNAWHEAERLVTEQIFGGVTRE